MTNVVVAKKRNISVSVNAVAGVISTTEPVVLKNTPTLISGTGVTRLDHLQDVIPDGETNGATLVYDSTTDKYIVEKLNLSDTVGNLDGGTF
jgi:hypothetical protein